MRGAQEGSRRGSCRQTEDGTIPAAQNAYLILVPDPLIARDLAETVSEFDAGARILLARSAAEAVERIAREAQITLAFLWLAPEAAGPLVPALAVRGARVVLFGPEADERRAMWRGEHLPMPFSTQMVMCLLRRLALR